MCRLLGRRTRLPNDPYQDITVPGQRFNSLELAGTTSLDMDALGRALRRSAMSHPDWGTDAIKVISIEIPGGDARFNQTWHVWWELPALWRDDYGGPFGETVVAIVRPDVALQYVSETRTVYTSERLGAADQRPRVSAPKGWTLPTIDWRLSESPLLGPRLPDSDWEIQTLGEESYLGRAARRMRATRRPESKSWEFRASGFWPGVDEYEYVIDDELQILLSLTALVDGARAATVSVEHVSVDQPIPANTFDFSPPVGTRIAEIDEKPKQ